MFFDNRDGKKERVGMDTRHIEGLVDMFDYNMVEEVLPRPIELVLDDEVGNVRTVKSMITTLGETGHGTTETKGAGKYIAGA